MDKELQAGVAQLRQGYTLLGKKTFRCLFCPQEYVQGNIYVFDRLVDAQTAIALHVRDAHRSAFHALLAQDKKITGLTEHQATVMCAFYEGLSDREIAEKLNISPATVRFQRFSLRERAQQARVFLALFEELEREQEDEL